MTATRFTDKHIQRRPAIVSDLSKSDQQGDQIATVQLNEIPVAALAKAGEFLLLCEKHGLLIESDVYRTSVYKPLTEEQADERIRRAQERWDNWADRYDAALVTRSYIEDWSDRASVETYCRKMG